MSTYKKRSILEGREILLNIFTGDSIHFSASLMCLKTQLARKNGHQSMADKAQFFIWKFLASDHLDKHKSEDIGVCLSILKLKLSSNILDIFYSRFPYKSHSILKLKFYLYYKHARHGMNIGHCAFPKWCRWLWK